jgi:glycosyltransferase involved in cell wall biosynthesis
MNHMGGDGPAAAPAACSVRVSVLVPVFNAMPYLTELLRSLAGQDIGEEAFDVVLVDDGSTDGGGTVVDSYCARHGNFRAVHQPNSGWPGGPRNTALAMSGADYVFFADADDVLAPSALRKMLEFADRHGSDIVIPQMAGLGGREVSPTMFRRTRVDTDLPAAFENLQPLKLYRRALLVNHGIRFPEGKIRLEDGIFNAHAYLAADRISILSGEDLYLLRSREDGQNLSSQRTNPSAYTSSVAAICRVVKQSSLDPDLQDTIVLGLYQRKCLRVYRPGRFSGYSAGRRKAWLDAHRAFIDEFIPTALEDRLPCRARARSRLVRAGDAARLAGLSRREDALRAVVPMRLIRKLGSALSRPRQS